MFVIPTVVALASVNNVITDLPAPVKVKAPRFASTNVLANKPKSLVLVLLMVIEVACVEA